MLFIFTGLIRLILFYMHIKKNEMLAIAIRRTRVEAALTFQFGLSKKNTIFFE